MQRLKKRILFIGAVTVISAFLLTLFWSSLVTLPFWLFLGNLAIANIVLADTAIIGYVAYKEFWR